MGEIINVSVLQAGISWEQGAVPLCPRALPVHGINWEKPSPAPGLCIIDEPLRAAMTYGLSCLAFFLDSSLGLVGSMAGYSMMEMLFPQWNAKVSHLQGGLGAAGPFLHHWWAWDRCGDRDRGGFPMKPPSPRSLAGQCSHTAKGSAFPKGFS